MKLKQHNFDGSLKIMKIDTHKKTSCIRDVFDHISVTGIHSSYRTVTMQEHALDVTCSQDTVAVRWKNPGVVFLNGLNNFDLTGVCIHGNKMLSYKVKPHCA